MSVVSVAPRIGATGTLLRGFPRADYFFRNRSSRTTSAPSLGFAGSSVFSAAGEGAATGKADGAGTAGGFAPRAATPAAASGGSHCQPNFTPRTRENLISADGTHPPPRSAPADKPASGP